MLGSTTPPSAYDLRFSWAGVPVRIHPSFWLVSLLLNLDEQTDYGQLLLWTCALLVSIIVHELGHAVAVRLAGGSPAITVHGLGGYCSYPESLSGTARRVAIALAGPLAGFLLAALVVLSLHLADRGLPFSLLPGIGGFLGGQQPIDNLNAWLLVNYLLYINIFWGLINLLPVWPLDGGHVTYALAQAALPRSGWKLTAHLSLLVAVAAALIAGLLWHQTFVALLFGLLAVQNWQTRRQSQP